MVSTTPAKSCSAVWTTPAKNLSPVSLTPAISPCHRFLVITGVVDAGDKFIVDTGDQLSAVTTTPAINLSPVTRTRTPWRWGAVKERRKLKVINRRYLRPPKSATAADDVTGAGMKSCIHTHPTHLHVFKSDTLFFYVAAGSKPFHCVANSFQGFSAR
jgi:hypothetical protein